MSVIRKDNAESYIPHKHYIASAVQFDQHSSHRTEMSKSPKYLPATQAKSLTSELFAVLASAVLSTMIAAWVLELWNANLRIPFSVGGDATINLAVIKATLQHGWYLTNPNLGAPFGQELYDFPAYSGDSLYLAMIKIFGILFSNPAVIINGFFLVSFPLIAISAFVVFRKLGISKGSAVVCSVLFASMPSHFWDGEGHIFEGSYFLVPLSCYFILIVFAGYDLFRRNAERKGVRAFLTWRSAGIMLICIAIGCSNNYYALFTVALLIIAATLRFLATRRVVTLLGGLFAAGVIVGVVALNGLPTLIYTAQHGRDAAVGQRLPQETDLYGLSLANLVIPIIGHRISAFANLASRYYSTAPTPTGEADFDNLGIIATLGAIWLIVMLAVRCIGGEFAKVIDSRYIYAALGAGTAFLIGTVGGLATLFAYVINPQLRAPNRIAIFIAFFALIGVALALDQARRWLTKRSDASWIPLIPLAAILLIGVLDQTSPSMVPPYQAEIAEYRNASALVGQIERTLPRDSAIFQLPYVPFPENPPVQRMQDYAELTGYIFSTNLRWSYGAIKGRPADWEATVVTRPVPLMLAEVSSAGFRGIYIDTFGYADGGAALIGTLRTQLGAIPTVSPDGRLYFFDIRSYYRRLRARHSPEEIAHLRTSALYPNAVSVCGKIPKTTLTTHGLKALCASGATPQLTS